MTGDRRGDDELLAALALVDVEGFGPARARVVLDELGTPSAVLTAFRSDGPDRERALAALERAGRRVLPRRVLERLGRARPAPASRLRELRRRRIRLVRYGGPGYPERLSHLYDPPVLLWLQGPGRLPAGRTVTVVGTRRATGYGRRMARDLAAGLAVRGWCVVSGMARGIDGAAHRGALDAEGETVGVLGSGLDYQYPAANREVYARMREAGLLATEFPTAEPPAPDHFPRRNRILAALADAVVVVQAGRRSGARITADLALELGREVLAVPGPVGPDASAGVHDLLREGAALVTEPEDVIAAVETPEGGRGEGRRDAGSGGGGRTGASAGLRAGASSDLPSRASPSPRPLPTASADDPTDVGPASRIRRRLEEGTAPADELAAASGLSTGAALALLGRLELLRIVRRLPGARYELRRDRPEPSGDRAGTAPGGARIEERDGDP